jgi:hypothetical protein
MLEIVWQLIEYNKNKTRTILPDLKAGADAGDGLEVSALILFGRGHSWA